MRSTARQIAATLMRGGTSKGLFLREKLPDELLARSLGSPDPYGMQLDGVGGSISSTSKVAIVTPHKGDLDVDSMFGQVDVLSGHVDWSGSCGNLAAAVGLFARERGLVPLEQKTVRIWQRNLGYRIDVTFGEADGGEEGFSERPVAVAIPGVPRASPPIWVDFVHPNMEGLALLPTGRVLDEVLGIDATLCCCANPTIFVRAADLLDLLKKEYPAESAVYEDEGEGKEVFLPDEYSAALGTLIHDMCRESAKLMGIEHSDAIRVSWLRDSMTYRHARGVVDAHSVDILGCISTTATGRVHHAFTTTGMINLAVMSCVQGTIPYEKSSGVGESKGRLRLGMPAGVVELHASCEKVDGVWSATRAGLVRTARTLMSGSVHIP